MGAPAPDPLSGMGPSWAQQRVLSLCRHAACLRRVLVPVHVPQEARGPRSTLRDTGGLRRGGRLLWQRRGSGCLSPGGLQIVSPWGVLCVWSPGPSFPTRNPCSRTSGF